MACGWGAAGSSSAELQRTSPPAAEQELTALLERIRMLKQEARATDLAFDREAAALRAENRALEQAFEQGCSQTPDGALLRQLDCDAAAARRSAGEAERAHAHVFARLRDGGEASSHVELARARVKALRDEAAALEAALGPLRRRAAQAAVRERVESEMDKRRAIGESRRREVLEELARLREDRQRRLEQQVAGLESARGALTTAVEEALEVRHAASREAAALRGFIASRERQLDTRAVLQALQLEAPAQVPFPSGSGVPPSTQALLARFDALAARAAPHLEPRVAALKDHAARLTLQLQLAQHRELQLRKGLHDVIASALPARPPVSSLS